MCSTPVLLLIGGLTVAGSLDVVPGDSWLGRSLLEGRGAAGLKGILLAVGRGVRLRRSAAW